MHASIKCDRTMVSGELFARHYNYVLLSCHLVSVQGSALQPKIQDKIAVLPPNQAYQRKM